MFSPQTCNLKRTLTAVKTSDDYILHLFVSCIFHWYKYCKQSQTLCLKTLFSSIFCETTRKTQDLNILLPMLVCYRIHEKSMYIFTETICLASFLEFSLPCVYLSTFCQPRFNTQPLWSQISSHACNTGI
jgi:hypothetical protein